MHMPSLCPTTSGLVMTLTFDLLTPECYMFICVPKCTGIKNVLKFTIAVYKVLCYAMVTCEIKFFQNYLSFHQCLSKMILFQHVETCIELFQNYFMGLLQLMNIFQHVHCR